MHLKKWLDFIYNREIVKYRFLKFLFGIIDNENKNHYLDLIKNLYFMQNKTLIISFQHIVIKDPILAIWLTDEPEQILRIFQETIKELIVDVFSEYIENHFNIFIRISDLPLCNSLVNLTESCNSTLVKIKGIVVSITNICSNLSFFKLVCLKCLQLQKQIFSTIEEKRDIFANCFNCKADGPFQISSYHSIYSDFQKINLQETDSINIYCKNINYKEIILKDELVGKVKLGEEIEITGIIKYIFELNRTYTNNVLDFSVFLDANFIENKQDYYDTFFFDSWEKKFISSMYKNKQILDFLVNSFAQKVIIDPNIRLGIILSLFGGKINKTTSCIKDKENLNILILGEHGTAGTKLLSSIYQILPKSIYILGEEIRLKELTASLKFDKLIGDWTIEGGVLVMTDKGYCIIDEICKMGILEKKFLKDAIFQKKIYIMRKGTINNFNTRCSIIASTKLSDAFSNFFVANPNSLEFYCLQKEFPSLFDLIYIIQDTIDSCKDKILANSIVNTINRNFFKKKNQIVEMLGDCDIINCFYFDNLINEKLIQKLISKYISYTRYFINSKLKYNDQILISNFYSSIRSEISSIGGFQITIKHLESLLLLIESSGRIHLRNNPNKIDVHLGISVMLRSFIHFQPPMIKNIIEVKFSSFFKLKNNYFSSILSLLIITMKNTHKFYIKKSFFEKLCSVFKIKNLALKKFYSSQLFISNGFKIDYEKIYIFFVNKINMK
nr:minichromosome maintenance component complex 2-like protein [Cryptomonas curvata]